MANDGLPGRLRAARIAAGHESAYDFARKIERNPNTVYRIESGRIVPSLETLRAWALACRVSTDSLLDLDGVV